MKIPHTIRQLLKVENLFLFDAAILSLIGAYLIVFPEGAIPYFPHQTWTAWPLRGLGSTLLLAALMSLVLAQTSDRKTLLHGTILFAFAHVFLSVLLIEKPWQWGPVSLGKDSVIAFGACTDIGGKMSCKPLFQTFGFQHPVLGHLAWLLAIAFVFSVIKGPWAGRNLRSDWEVQIREAASQEERNRLARELHDSIKQQIFAIQTSVAAAQVRLANGAEGALAALDDARQSAREATVEMETMLDQLQAAPLETQGLVAAIRKLCEALGFRTGAAVKVEIGELPAVESMGPGAHQALYRIAQETVSNIAKHARAKQVDVKLGSDEHGCLSLVIRDDGQGFDVVNGNRGMGLRNLQSRAEEVGGWVAIQSQQGVGTVVEACLPMEYQSRNGIGTTLQFLIWFGILVPFFDGFSIVSSFAGAAITAGAAIALGIRRRR
jgi:signal transduction histidine kinase